VTTCAGYALQFDGASSVKVARPVQDDFTIEAWIKTIATARDGVHYWNGVGLFWADVVGDSDDFGAAMLAPIAARRSGARNSALGARVQRNGLHCACRSQLCSIVPTRH
jgi:hypothetical protein